MGEFFKKEEETSKEETDEVINDYENILDSFNTLSSRIQQTLDESGEAIVPIINELQGDFQQDIGQIGQIRRQLQSYSRLGNMSIGQLMLKIVDNVETLIKWTNRYEEYLEEFIKSQQIICKSSFNEIDKYLEKIDKIDGKMQYLEEQIIVKDKYMKEMQDEYENVLKGNTNKQIKVNKSVVADEYFREIKKAFDENYKRYLANPGSVTKSSIFNTVRKNTVGYELTSIWFEQAESERKAISEPKQKKFSTPKEPEEPISPNENSYGPISDNGDNEIDDDLVFKD